jgi:hypothetical protein
MENWCICCHWRGFGAYLQFLSDASKFPGPIKQSLFYNEQGANGINASFVCVSLCCGNNWLNGMEEGHEFPRAHVSYHLPRFQIQRKVLSFTIQSLL